jgi:hypothetical protein
MPFSVSSDEGQKTPKTSQVTEKFSRAKIRLSDSGDSQIGLFHALEARSRNHGKRGHWTDLDAAYGGFGLRRTGDQSKTVAMLDSPFAFFWGSHETFYAILRRTRCQTIFSTSSSDHHPVQGFARV